MYAVATVLEKFPRAKPAYSAGLIKLFLASEIAAKIDCGLTALGSIPRIDIACFRQSIWSAASKITNFSEIPMTPPSFLNIFALKL